MRSTRPLPAHHGGRGFPGRSNELRDCSLRNHPGALDGYFTAVRPTLEFPNPGDIRGNLTAQVRTLAHLLSGTSAGRLVTELIGAAHVYTESGAGNPGPVVPLSEPACPPVLKAGVTTGEQLHRATGIAPDAGCGAGAGTAGGGRSVPELSKPVLGRQQHDRQDEAESEQRADKVKVKV